MPAPAAPTQPKAPPIGTDADLLQLEGMSPGVIRGLLERTRFFAGASPLKRWDALAGRFVVNLFLEDSTRTRLSFSIAAQRLGAAVLDVAGAGSSISKGETLVDTARVLEAQGASVIIVRVKAPGAPHTVAGSVECAVLNAGDGGHEHPTQGLLDAYTLAEAQGRLDGFDLSGLRVAIVGDIAHSRVARSDVAAMTALGAEVICVGPPNMAPASLAALGCAVGHDLDAVIGEVDAVQMLRVQVERGAAMSSKREYVAQYQLDAARAARMKRGAVVMHPGPMNRGVELSDEVADGATSRIFRQDTVGVFVRMAALERAAIACEWIGGHLS
jgi:aspartate carbamoyltransferase catalytic subunit